MLLRILADVPGRKKAWTSSAACGKLFCRLGCVCDSLASVSAKKEMQEAHCKRSECMMLCVCGFRKDRPHWQARKTTFYRLLKGNESFYSKIDWSGQRQRRERKIPERFRDSVFHLDSDVVIGRVLGEEASHATAKSQVNGASGRGRGAASVRPLPAASPVAVRLTNKVNSIAAPTLPPAPIPTRLDTRATVTYSRGRLPTALLSRSNPLSPSQAPAPAPSKPPPTLTKSPALIHSTVPSSTAISSSRVDSAKVEAEAGNQTKREPFRLKVYSDQMKLLRWDSYVSLSKVPPLAASKHKVYCMDHGFYDCQCLEGNRRLMRIPAKFTPPHVRINLGGGGGGGGSHDSLSSSLSTTPPQSPQTPSPPPRPPRLVHRDPVHTPQLVQKNLFVNTEDAVFGAVSDPPVAGEEAQASSSKYPVISHVRTLAPTAEVKRKLQASDAAGGGDGNKRTSAVNKMARLIQDDRFQLHKLIAQEKSRIFDEEIDLTIRSVEAVELVAWIRFHRIYHSGRMHIRVLMRRTGPVILVMRPKELLAEDITTDIQDMRHDADAPVVVQELLDPCISAEETSRYALLHCDGVKWELIGCLSLNATIPQPQQQQPKPPMPRLVPIDPLAIVSQSSSADRQQQQQQQLKIRPGPKSKTQMTVGERLSSTGNRLVTLPAPKFSVAQPFLQKRKVEPGPPVSAPAPAPAPPLQSRPTVHNVILPHRQYTASAVRIQQQPTKEGALMQTAGSSVTRATVPTSATASRFLINVQSLAQAQTANSTLGKKAVASSGQGQAGTVAAAAKTYPAMQKVGGGLLANLHYPMTLLEAHYSIGSPSNDLHSAGACKSSAATELAASGSLPSCSSSSSSSSPSPSSSSSSTTTTTTNPSAVPFPSLKVGSASFALAAFAASAASAANAAASKVSSRHQSSSCQPIQLAPNVIRALRASLSQVNLPSLNSHRPNAPTSATLTAASSSSSINVIRPFKVFQRATATTITKVATTTAAAATATASKTMTTVTALINPTAAPAPAAAAAAAAMTIETPRRISLAERRLHAPDYDPTLLPATPLSNDQSISISLPGAEHEHDNDRLDAGVDAASRSPTPDPTLLPTTPSLLNAESIPFPKPSDVTINSIRLPNGNWSHRLKIIYHVDSDSGIGTADGNQATVLLPLHSEDDQWCMVAIDYVPETGLEIPGSKITIPQAILEQAAQTACARNFRVSFPLHVYGSQHHPVPQKGFGVYGIPNLPCHVFLGPFPCHYLDKFHGSIPYMVHIATGPTASASSAGASADNVAAEGVPAQAAQIQDGIASSAATASAKNVSPCDVVMPTEMGDACGDSNTESSLDSSHELSFVPEDRKPVSDVIYGKRSQEKYHSSLALANAIANVNDISGAGDADDDGGGSGGDELEILKDIHLATREGNLPKMRTKRADELPAKPERVFLARVQGLPPTTFSVLQDDTVVVKNPLRPEESLRFASIDEGKDWLRTLSIIARNTTAANAAALGATAAAAAATTTTTAVVIPVYKCESNSRSASASASEDNRKSSASKVVCRGRGRGRKRARRSYDYSYDDDQDDASSDADSSANNSSANTSSSNTNTTTAAITTNTTTTNTSPTYRNGSSSRTGKHHQHIHNRRERERRGVMAHRLRELGEILVQVKGADFPMTKVSVLKRVNKLAPPPLPTTTN